jgi:succinylarginine dihydrolase
VEVNFDGLVGPTHHYGGLSTGNIASLSHRWEVSRPRLAALQGLAKMVRLAELGVAQAVLPPQERPVWAVLRAAGFSGSEEAMVKEAGRESPGLLSACYSASAMWAANAATFTPAVDASDGRAHFTPANLVSMFHRSLESPVVGTLLRHIFGDERYFVHHDPLPPGRPLSDEGAANHTRLGWGAGGAGVHLFVYGFSPFEAEAPLRFPARQSLEASRAIARWHRIPPERCLFARQSPAAIDAGVFHNDVAAVGNEHLFLYHEEAWAEGGGPVEELRARFAEICGGRLQCRAVAASQVSLSEAVATYLFNSQLVTLPTGGMLLLAPEECRASARVGEVIAEWLADESNPIRQIEYADLRQSMRNGGGPACLRLRVILTEEERRAVRGRVFLTPDLAADLAAWIDRNYRETLSPPDLGDPRLIEESRRAQREVEQLLGLGPIGEPASSAAARARP